MNGKKMLGYAIVGVVLAIILTHSLLVGTAFQAAVDYLDFRIEGLSHAQAMHELGEYSDNIARMVGLYSEAKSIQQAYSAYWQNRPITDNTLGVILVLWLMCPVMLFAYIIHQPSNFIVQSRREKTVAWIGIAIIVLCGLLSIATML